MTNYIYETDDFLEFEQHPISRVFPPMGLDEMTDLATDVQTNGLRNPIIVYEGMVLDGWHRYQACILAGINPDIIKFDGRDPSAFVRSQNFHRRQMTLSQKAMVEVQLAMWAPVGSNQHPGSEPGSDPRTVKQMAKAAGVSTKTIEEAKEVVRAGLGEVVKEGRCSVKRGAEIARLPEVERWAALKALKEPIQPKPPKPKVNPSDMNLQARIASLELLLSQREELISELMSRPKVSLPPKRLLARSEGPDDSSGSLHKLVNQPGELVGVMWKLFQNQMTDVFTKVMKCKGWILITRLLRRYPGGSSDVDPRPTGSDQEVRGAITVASTPSNVTRDATQVSA